MTTPSGRTAPQAAVFEATGIVKRFGSFTALRGVSLSIRPGEVTALAGPNGAGKTTLFHVLSGSLRPDAGRVTLDRADVTGFAPWKMARLGVGRLFQDVRAFGGLTVRENVSVALAASGGDPGDAARWLDCVGLGDRADVRAEALSLVERRLLSLARLMAQRARVLLLDEPAAALPPDEADRVCGIVRRLAEEGRAAVALVEHDMSVVRRVADTVCFLHEGVAMKSGTVDEVLGCPPVRALYEDGGDAAVRSAPGAVKFVDSADAVFDARGRLAPNTAYLRREGNVFPSLTVGDNLRLAGWAADPVRASVRRMRVLEMFPFLSERLGQRAGTLSGGQRQALAIAMTMSRDARVYFFDEPSAGLAPRTASGMFSAIRRFAASGGVREVFVRESRKSCKEDSLCME